MRAKKGKLRRGRPYVLRIKDGKEFDISGKLSVTGGLGDRIAAYDTEDDSTRLLEIVLPR